MLVGGYFLVRGPKLGYLAVRDSCAIVRDYPLSCCLAGAVQGFGQVLFETRQEVAVAIERDG